MGISIYTSTHPLPSHSLQQTDLTFFSANKNDVYVASSLNEVWVCNVCVCVMSVMCMPCVRCIVCVCGVCSVIVVCSVHGVFLCGRVCSVDVQGDRDANKIF